MSKLETTAEMIKLARILGMEKHAVGYLASLPPHEIRRLREAALKRMFTRDSVMFSRVAKASRLLPNGLVAKLGEKVFGPMLAARIAGEMPTDRAVDIANRMSIPFLADVAIELDPVAAKEIIRAMPAQRVALVAAELLKRGDFITMGRFTDQLSEKTLRTVLNSIQDDEALLHIGFFMESKKRLSDVVRMLSDERLRSMINHAQKKPTELWPEALGLMTHVDDDLKQRLGDLAADQDEEVLAGLAGVAHKLQLWGDVLPVIACMSPLSQTKLMALPILQDVPVMEGILQSTDENRLWEVLLPQIKNMSEPQLAQVAEIATSLPKAAQERLITAARSAGLWDQLFGIVASLPKPKRASIEEIVARFASLDHSLVDELAGQAKSHGLDDLLAIAQNAIKSK